VNHRRHETGQPKLYKGPDGAIVYPHEVTACHDVAMTHDGLVLVRLESEHLPDLALTMTPQLAGGIIVAMAKAAGLKTIRVQELRRRKGGAK
jgi:hypothetical protein